jgi:hypothetical protein
MYSEVKKYLKIMKKICRVFGTPSFHYGIPRRRRKWDRKFIQTNNYRNLNKSMEKLRQQGFLLFFIRIYSLYRRIHTDNSD